MKRSPLIASSGEHSYLVENADVDLDADLDLACKGMGRSPEEAEGAHDSRTSLPNRQTSPGRRGRSYKRAKRLNHAPVQYSLVIHPPLIVENLLPEKGRFELMHATRRIVVWWADLKAGERIPVHTVGLDAPLLLLVNLGFCRTPVGEGALVHQGTSDTIDPDKRGIIAANQAGLQAIGKVVTKTTQTVYKGAAKTITAIAEGESQRGAAKIAALQSPVTARDEERVGNKEIKKQKHTGVFGFETDADAFDAGNFEGSGDALSFGQEDIATETTVVDSLGQRLGLCIDNNLGSGGQRHVTIYCPFWIVNTTEHALRYKQEKTNVFVSGTVSSPDNDGSRPVDGSTRNYDSPSDLCENGRRAYRGTVFSGTPGALATTSSGETDGLPAHELIELLNNEMPLEKTARLAAMFNFHEILALGGQQRRMCVQLHDGTGRTTYSSDWSSGFGLDSVGVTQIVAMHCRDRRSLEVSVSIGVAPGRLAQYTKIIRFSPRYVLVNQLSR